LCLSLERPKLDQHTRLLDLGAWRTDTKLLRRKRPELITEISLGIVGFRTVIKLEYASLALDQLLQRMINSHHCEDQDMLQLSLCERKQNPVVQDGSNGSRLGQAAYLSSQDERHVSRYAAN